MLGLYPSSPQKALQLLALFSLVNFYKHEKDLNTPFNREFFHNLNVANDCINWNFTDGKFGKSYSDKDFKTVKTFLNSKDLWDSSLNYFVTNQSVMKIDSIQVQKLAFKDPPTLKGCKS